MPFIAGFFSQANYHTNSILLKPPHRYHITRPYTTSLVIATFIGLLNWIVAQCTLTLEKICQANYLSNSTVIFHSVVPFLFSPLFLSVTFFVFSLSSLYVTTDSRRHSFDRLIQGAVTCIHKDHSEKRNPFIQMIILENSRHVQSLPTALVVTVSIQQKGCLSQWCKHKGDSLEKLSKKTSFSTNPAHISTNFAWELKGWIGSLSQCLGFGLASQSTLLPCRRPGFETRQWHKQVV